MSRLLLRHQSVKMASIFIIKKRNCHLQRKRMYIKEHCRQRKREECFHSTGRGGYLTKAVLDELLDLIQKAGKEKQKNARISLNWPQAVIRFDYVEDHGEAEPEVVVEEANEGEKE